MSLNTIELPEFVIADLYRNSLVGGAAGEQTTARSTGQGPQPAKIPQSPVTPIPQSPVTPKKETPTGYKFLGNNGRKVTLVVNSPGSAYLPDDQLAFLAKMLEACKMNMGDVALVNYATAPVNISALKPQLQPSVLVLFGIEPIGISLPINFPLYKIQAFDACDYLYASSLEDLVKPTEEGKLLKTKLWICLKQLFGV